MTKSSDPRERLLSEPLRGYLILVCSFIATFASVQFLRGSNTSAFISAGVALLGLWYQQKSTPGIVLLILGGFWFVAAQWDGATTFNYSPRSAAFSLMDLVQGIGILGYILTHYRILLLIDRYYPEEYRFAVRTPQGTLPPRRRNPQSINDAEYARLGVRLVVVVGLAHILWVFMANLMPDSDAMLHVRPIPSGEPLQSGAAQRTRLIMMGLILGLVTLTSSFAIWWLRQRHRDPLSAKLLLLDTEWAEARPELHRTEQWRARAPLTPEKSNAHTPS
ncbi:MAG: hypothetical protein ACRCZF_17840 [Gemmataceae bacterium]